MDTPASLLGFYRAVLWKFAKGDVKKRLLKILQEVGGWKLIIHPQVWVGVI